MFTYFTPDCEAELNPNPTFDINYPPKLGQVT